MNVQRQHTTAISTMKESATLWMSDLVCPRHGLDVFAKKEIASSTKNRTPLVQPVASSFTEISRFLTLRGERHLASDCKCNEYWYILILKFERHKISYISGNRMAVVCIKKEARTNCKLTNHSRRTSSRRNRNKWAETGMWKLSRDLERMLMLWFCYWVLGYLTTHST
jgi:hypothetical protein